MNKAELIEEIKKVCKVRNDIEIDMVVTGEDWSFDAKYVFLGESGTYVTDTLYLLNIDELDTDSLSRIYEKIASKWVFSYYNLNEIESGYYIPSNNILDY